MDGETEEKIDEYMETQHRREHEGDSAQAQEGIAEDPEGIDTAVGAFPIAIDEEDGLTLEEFGMIRKEKQEQGRKSQYEIEEWST